MLVLDSEGLKRQNQKLQKELYFEKLRLWEEDKVKNAIYVTDDDLSPGNWERQKGKELTTQEFEKKILKIFPGARFATLPKNTSKRCMYRILPSGEPQSLCVYENGKMTEHSVLRVTEEDTLDINPTNTDAITHIDRRDLPKHEWNPATGQYEFDKTHPMPGSKRSKVAARELSRGWRTVLIKLVEQGVINFTQAEKEFGIPNCQKWAFHGKKRLNLASPF